MAAHEPRLSKSRYAGLVQSVNHEMIEEIHFPYIDWRKPGYASLPACSRVRQTCWKPKRAWNWMRVIAAMIPQRKHGGFGEV